MPPAWGTKPALCAHLAKELVLGARTTLRPWQGRGRVSARGWTSMA